MAECWSSNGPFDCVLGLREANPGSGVGLFNEQLARRLGVPYGPLLPALSTARHPLVSLKFEELDSTRRTALAEAARSASHRPLSLFLHTLDGSAEEQALIAAARHVFCGNDWIAARLAARLPPRRAVRAFAPSLIDEAATFAPALELFSFGMAGKVDTERFARLAEMLESAGLDYRLVCSLAVHQTSDGRCLPRAVEFLAGCFGSRLLHLGTLTDAGIAYFLTGRVFVGFFKDGVRGNNTTLNTALARGCRIVTNLDDYSPPEVRQCPRVIDLDSTTPAELARFLQPTAPSLASARPGSPFTWPRLIELIRAETAGALSHRARAA
jgi:hypothetical protein